MRGPAPGRSGPSPTPPAPCTPSSRSPSRSASGAAAKTNSGAHATDPARITPSLYENFTDLGFMVLNLTQSSADLTVYTVDPSTAQPTNAFQRRLA
ncbi:hypothetical protein [Nocardia sp. NBC_01388]|uniref:hypothetical protein n=1 Tax=Nocardia sp. NBC_01388 TaxID=2903596 RepID=UPI003249471B